eukprot:3292549-Rhodomonas_salina.4
MSVLRTAYHVLPPYTVPVRAIRSASTGHRPPYAMSVHPEIEYKKPQSQYSLNQECGFLYLISGSMSVPHSTPPPRHMPVPDMAHSPRNQAKKTAFLAVATRCIPYSSIY